MEETGLGDGGGGVARTRVGTARRPRAQDPCAQFPVLVGHFFGYSKALGLDIRAALGPWALDMDVPGPLGSVPVSPLYACHTTRGISVVTP